MLVTRNWLREYLGDATPSTEEIVRLLTLHAFEVEGTSTVGEEEVIDVDILPNRSSDCLSVRGIAHEVAALTASTLAHDLLRKEARLEPATDQVKVHIENPNACTRFGMAVMSGIKVGESPEWLRARLEAVGQRPINNVVDATNYVMFALGQPLHAYDGRKIPQKDGAWHFGVRPAREGETVITLSNEEVALDPSIQIIVDGSADVPAGIAGIKGGIRGEVDTDTTTIILEAANFDPTLTRKAAQKLRLQTDASKRFENEVPREFVPYALRAVIALLGDIAGGTCEGYVDAYPTQRDLLCVPVTLAHINAYLGLELTTPDVEDIFNRLAFTYTSVTDGWNVTAPFERTDIVIAEDVIEEVGRVYGYEHIKAVVPEAVPLAEINTRHYYSEMIRSVLIPLGFSEVITSSFRKKDSVCLRNALASDKGCLRSSLQKNLSDVLERNIQYTDLLGVPDVRVFEIGTVFYKQEAEPGIREHVAVALGVRTKQQGYAPKDDDILREALDNLEKTLDVRVDAQIEKGIVELNLTSFLGQLPAPEAYNAFKKDEDVQYRPFSQYPFVSRDIALWVPEGTVPVEVADVLRATCDTLCVRATLFDEFRKDDRVSYAFRLVFQSNTKTLTDAEVNERMEVVSAAVEEKGWEVR